MNPPNTESDKSIDELLDKYYQDRTLDLIERTTFFAKAGEAVEPAKWHTTAKDQLYSLLMDVIGEDEVGLPAERMAIDIIKNELRAEQRTKLNKLFNKEETSK